jgi:hypothetical protein
VGLITIVPRAGPRGAGVTIGQKEGAGGTGPESNDMEIGDRVRGS